MSKYYLRGVLIMTMLLLNNWASQVQKIDVLRAKELFNNGVYFLDIRPKQAFVKGRIHSAINFAIDDHSMIKHPKRLSRKVQKFIFGKTRKIDLYKKIVIYGATGNMGSILAQRLIDQGHKRIYYFANGFSSWQQAQYPMQ